MLPPPARLAELVLVLKKATTCRACGKVPISACNTASVQDGQAGGPGLGYAGQLLASPSCGHAFCGECWARASANAAVQSGQASKCPICKGAVHLPPRPVVPSLPLGESNEGEHAEGQNENAGHTSRGGMASEDLGLGHTQLPPESAEPLRALLGMLRQLRGADVPTNAENDAAGIGTHILQRRMSGAGAHAEADPEQETEVPGTCLPALQHGACDNGAGESGDVKCASAQRSEVAEMPTVQENQLSSLKSGVKKTAVAETPTVHESKISSLESGVKRPAVAETPTVHESQVSSLRLSSIKSGAKRTENEHFGESEGNGETEVPGTYLSPLHAKLNGGQYEGKLFQAGQRTPEETGVNIQLLPQDPDLRRDQKNCNAESLQQTKTLVKGVEKTSEPVAFSPVKESKSSVPRTNLPPMHGNSSMMPQPLSNMDPFPGSSDNAALKWRRITASPEKMRSPRSPPPSLGKRPRGNRKPSPLRHKDDIATDIRPWNIESAPVMSPLTCDVKTCRIGRPLDNSPLHSVRKNLCTAQKRTLYLAYDVLDSLEMQALSMLHSQGCCRVVCGGIQQMEGSKRPFPAILVTHSVYQPGFGSQEKGATCDRSYSYLKAKALGARVVDARWLLDSQNAGGMLDWASYEVWGDLESYHSLSSAERCARHGGASTPSNKFHGVTFGLLRAERGCNLLEDPFEDDTQLVTSQLALQTRPMTTPEVESLVQCWGGCVTKDLVHMDMLLVDDLITLDDIANRLKRHMSHWRIETWTEDELSAIVHDGALNTVRIPIVRTKWVESCIALNTMRSMTPFCCGMLCL